MCGVCGKLIWKQPGTVSSPLLEGMNRSMTHRGPDDEGYFYDSLDPQKAGFSGSLGLAMRRLSIIDLVSGRQPIKNETGDVVVVYNGECYNFQDLRSELQNLGHTFTTNSDTEVLVHGYEEWGEEMPARLNGMFGFALWDRKKARLLLVRDRMGIKPLYYALFDHQLVFGSEIKALLADSSVPLDLDPTALDDFLSLRYIPTPSSIYTAIRKLEPATMLIWEKGQVRFKKYWTFEPADFKDRGLPYYLEKLDGLLADAVQRQLISDVPIGTFLSGGLDSPPVFETPDQKDSESKGQNSDDIGEKKNETPPN
ncbi:MAG: asparagine synthase (glutamine-hydrolyzing) [Elusimicrobia bacterium]|nr:asparagine synthase (glutamine-hydrolyzing) [Candidatus Obscuribacterium magneticum]